MSLFYIGDPFIDIIFGSIVGVLFSIKSRKSNQSTLQLGSIVGSLGGLLAAFSIALFKFTIFILNLNLIPLNIFFLYILGDFLIAILTGFIIGTLIGLIFLRKVKKVKVEHSELDNFLKNLTDN